MPKLDPELEHKLVWPQRRRGYPRDWDARRALALRLAGGRCQHPGCGLRTGDRDPASGKPVALQVAHWSWRVQHSRPLELVVLCRRHHLEHDRLQHLRTKQQLKYARREASGQLALDLTPRDLEVPPGADLLRILPELKEFSR